MDLRKYVSAQPFAILSNVPVSSEKEIEIPNEVNTINLNPFIGWNNLETIHRGENESFCVDDGVLFNALKTELICYPSAKTLKEYVVVDGVKQILGAFANCKTIEEIVLPQSLERIAPRSFENCKSLKKINIPDKVVNIGDDAFFGCDRIQCLEGNGVTVMGMIFGNSKKAGTVKPIVFPKVALSKIKTEYYKVCLALGFTLYPERYGKSIRNGYEKYLQDNAEMLIEAANKLELSKTVDYLKNNVGLNDKVKISEAVHRNNVQEKAENESLKVDEKTLDDYKEMLKISKRKNYQTGEVWYEVSGQKNKEKAIIIPGFIEGIPVCLKDGAFSGDKYIESIILGEGVFMIRRDALCNCPQLQTISLPASLREIENGYIAGKNLKEIQVDSENVNYSSKDGVLYSKDFTKLYCCPGKKEGVLILHESTTEIGRCAFAKCDELTEIWIPDTVTIIGDAAFSSEKIKFDGNDFVFDYSYVIHAATGSYAETYAKEKSIPYVVD